MVEGISGMTVERLRELRQKYDETQHYKFYIPTLPDRVLLATLKFANKYHLNAEPQYRCALQEARKRGIVW